LPPSKLPPRLSEPGPLLTYLSHLQTQAPEHLRPLALEHIHAIREILATEEGAMLMDLLEKSTALSFLPVMSDERALVARNAQALILSDLRRIASNETELLRQAAEASAGRTRRRPG
jgi:hypothetical protein